MTSILVLNDPKLLKTIKVRFKGTKYWLISETRPGGGRAIAPLAHCDSRGNVVDLFALSYAHLCPDGNISRFGTIIGTQEDLEII